MFFFECFNIVEFYVLLVLLLLSFLLLVELASLQFFS